MVPPKLVRRILIPVLLALEWGLAAVLGVVALIGLVLAPIDRRLRLSRVALTGIAYIGVETVALVGLASIWFTKPFRPHGRYERANARVLAWALAGVLGAGRRFLGFAMSVQDPPDLTPLDQPEPVMVLARHGGLADSYALVWLLVERYGRIPRVVLKEALLWEPLIDVALTRLEACFLPKAAGSEEDRASLIGALAAELGPHDALLLFPEGQNWTPQRHRRAISRLRRDHNHRAAWAGEVMGNVLPPRPGGVLAALDSCPGIPVAILAHTGLDRLTTATAAWRAIPFAQEMTVRWWRVAAAPEGREARIAWLTTEWAVVDEWIDSRRASGLSRAQPVI